MGKTYLFECPLCHYRVHVSGGADSGLHCEIQTVICRDCRELYDVFTRQRCRVGAVEQIRFPGFHRPEIPPVILRQSLFSGFRTEPPPLEWRDTPPQCPVTTDHFVEPWNDPGRCPRCGNFMEKNGFPFRAWE